MSGSKASINGVHWKMFAKKIEMPHAILAVPTMVVIILKGATSNMRRRVRSIESRTMVTVMIYVIIETKKVFRLISIHVWKISIDDRYLEKGH